MKAIETQKDTIEEQNIKSLWTALRVAEGQTEKRGLQFGEAIYKLREKYKIQGTRNDLSSLDDKLEGYLSVLNKLGIPEATARRWRIRYEESIGTRAPKGAPEPDSGSESKTTSYEIEPAVSEATHDDVNLPSEVPVDRSFEPKPSPASTSTPVVTTEKKEEEQLDFLVKRLSSLSEALQQFVNEKAKWSKHHEKYAKVESLVEKIADLFN